MIGTHDIQYFLTRSQSMDITVEIVYSEHSCAAGALIIFVFINDSRDVDFTKSAFLALSRSASPILPLGLDLGQYKVFTYDIESDGTLAGGVGYPAVSRQLIVSEMIQGNLVEV